MKKLPLILSIVSIVATAVLYIVHFSAKSDSCTTESAQTVQTAGPGSIVYVQIDTLFNQYDMSNDLKTELEAKASGIQKDLEKKGRSFENDVKSFQDQIQKGLLTRSQAETMQNELQTRQNTLQSFQLEKQQEMAEEESVMVNKVMEAIRTFIDKYNKEHGYAIILTTSAASQTILQGDSALD
ncbi:MAG: OmpH family outer membrane protein, partial [Alistipes sp.]|nr:OmpH family outer membrane protein [Candidatus Minthomonas equi]